MFSLSPTHSPPTHAPRNSLKRIHSHSQTVAKFLLTYLSTPTHETRPPHAPAYFCVYLHKGWTYTYMCACHLHLKISLSSPSCSDPLPTNRTHSPPVLTSLTHALSLRHSPCTSSLPMHSHSACTVNRHQIDDVAAGSQPTTHGRVDTPRPAQFQLLTT